MRVPLRGNSWRLLLPAALLLAVLCVAASAPAKDLAREYGFTVDAVVARIEKLL